MNRAINSGCDYKDTRAYLRKEVLTSVFNPINLSFDNTLSLLSFCLAYVLMFRQPIELRDVYSRRR